MKSAFRCDIGCVRQSNQDAVFCSDHPFGPLDNLYIVADGMGGHRAGDVASNEAIRAFTAYVRQAEGKHPLEIFQRALDDDNACLYRLSREREVYAGMGTTLVGATLCRNRIYIVNVGDSRLYCLRSETGRLERMTEDHSVIQELINAGEITEEEARNHPGRHMITRALGTDSQIEGDYYEIPYSEADSFLLCSDGLTGAVPEEDIREILQQAPTAEAAAEALVEEAKKNGGHDNISVIILAETVQRQEEGKC